MTAHDICVTNNWLKEGAFNLRFMHILNPRSIEFDTLLSRRPYVSFPPGVFIPPFLIAKIFNVQDLQLLYESYDLFTHLVIAIFLFLLMFMIINYFNEIRPVNIFFSVIPSLIYLYTPPTLFWHQNNVFTDALVMVYFVIFLYLEVKRYLYKSLSVLDNLFLAGIVFMGALTDWLFVFVVFVAVGLRIFFDRYGKNVWMLMLDVKDLLIPSGLAIALFIYQILSMGLLPKLIWAFNRRHLGRPGVVRNLLDQHFARLVIPGYGETLFISAILCAVFLLIYFIDVISRERTKEDKVIAKIGMRLVLLTTIPCFFQIYVFQEHTVVHLFPVLKWALFLSLIPFGVFPIIFIRLIRSHPNRKFILSIFFIFAVVGIFWGVFYRTSVQYKDYFHIGKGDNNKNMGELVKRHAQYRDICFSTDFDIPEAPPERLAYSGKRVYWIDNIAEINGMLSKLVRKNAYYNNISFATDFNYGPYADRLSFAEKKACTIIDAAEIKDALSKFANKGARVKIFVHKKTWKRIARDIEKICPVVYMDSDYYICETGG